MERIRKSATLKQTYYRSFLLLVVIPLVLVFVGAEVAIGMKRISSSSRRFVQPWSPPRIFWQEHFIWLTEALSI